VQKLDVLLRGCYLFRDMPFLRVTFIDFSKASESINENLLRGTVVAAKRTELLTYDSATGEPLFVDAPITEPVSE